MSIFRCRFLLTISQNKDVHYLSTFHSNYSGLRALISGGGEHGLVTSRRCPSPLTCSLQLIVVTRRRGGGGHWGWTESQREGALPPSWDIILQVDFISLWWEKCSYFVLSCISKFPHQIIVMFCLISQYHCQALQKMHIS